MWLLLVPLLTQEPTERRIMELEHARTENAAELVAALKSPNARTQRLAVRAIGRLERPALQRSRQSIVRSVARMGEELGISILAEGVETVDEFLALQAMGIRLMQGYLFGKPRFEACAVPGDIAWPPGSST